MYFESLRRLKSWSWSKWYVKSANLLTQQAILFHSFTVGIAHHSAKSSRVMIAGHGIVIIRVMGAWVTGISLSQCHLAAYTFSSWYWNTSFCDFVRNIWKVASWWFHCLYPCLRFSIAYSGGSELISRRLQIRQVLWEKWFRRFIFTKLKCDSSTRCCTICDIICTLSSLIRQHIAAAE